MVYLVVKIATLLVLAALAGALMMYAWLKSQYEDVTDGYGLMLSERAAERSDLAQHRRELLGALEERLGGRDDELAALEHHRDAIVEAVRREVVGPLESRIDARHGERVDAEARRDERLASLMAKLESMDDERLARLEELLGHVLEPEIDDNPLLSRVRALLDETHVLEVRTVRRSPADA